MPNVLLGSVWARSRMIGGIGTGGLVIVCEVDSEYVHYRFVDDDLDGHNNFTRNIYEFVNNFKEVKYGSN